MFCGVGEDGQRFTAEGEVRLPGAHIGGQLGFSGARLTNLSDVALTADGLEVDGDMFCGVRKNKCFPGEGEVRLLGAHIGGTLAFEGARLSNEGCRALSADGLRVDRTMSCEDFVATGEVRLIGAHIGGQLTLAGATLRNDTWPALNAAGLQVDQRMLCTERFNATGQVSLPAAHVGGQLSLAGATLRNDTGPALNAAGLRVDQRMLCNEGFSATGEVRLPGAHISGLLDFSGAQLATPSGAALRADRVQVDGDMLCSVGKDEQGFTTEGEISLSGAHINGELTFAGGILCGRGVALRLKDAKLRALSLEFAAAPPGVVDLRGARAERCTDRLYAPPLACGPAAACAVAATSRCTQSPRLRSRNG
jgi:hypothetical protein